MPQTLLVHDSENKLPLAGPGTDSIPQRPIDAATNVSRTPLETRYDVAMLTISTRPW
jgi:hypothetical protein